MNNESRIRAFACSIFKNEIEYLVGLGQLPPVFTYIDSDLHMYPQQLETVLTQLLEPGCFLCYGTCHSHMKQQQDRGLFNRVEGLNCCEILLGRTDYRRLRSEGAFFLLPEWTMKWEHVFKELLGFSEHALAAEFMNEMHTKLIYLNTGVSPVPTATLDAIAEYLSLPVEIFDIDLTHLRDAICGGMQFPLK